MEKYTVVIPTRNSIETLKHTLSTCLTQTYSNFEILVSDNCSDDNTEEYIRDLRDKRVRYIKTGKPMSMTENFEFALSNAREGYIMFLGADDGLMPDAIKYVNEIVLKFNTKVVACQYARFIWPSAPIQENGQLILNVLNVHKSDLEIRLSSEWIHKTLAFNTKLYVCDLPSLYYGFIHRSVINKAVKDGVYFRSITPDAYSAFATAVHIDTYAFSNRPFIIAGISGKSNGLSQSIGSDISRNFVKENVHPIHKDFVYCSALQVIMGEAFFQLAEAFPIVCKDYHIDFLKMLQKAFPNTNDINYFQIIGAIKKMAKMHNIDFEKIIPHKRTKLYKLFRRSVQMFMSFLTNGGKYLGMKDSTKFSIYNIYEASIALGILESNNRGNQIETVGSRFINRIKNRLFFKSSKSTM